MRFGRLAAALAAAALALVACEAGGTGSPTAAPDPSEAGSRPDPDLDTELIAAAWRNDVAAARELIERGADVNAVDDTQQSAHLIAASEGHFELLQLTLASGAAPGVLDSYSGTGLIRAAERGHADIVGRLIPAGTPVDHVNRLGWTALHEALIFANQGASENRGGAGEYVDTVRVLVAAGADVRLAAQDGRTPGQLASASGLTAQARLLARAADLPGIERPLADRRLLDAAASGDADGAVLALRGGAALEARNEQSQTPLLLAAANDQAEVARLLVYLGADPDAVDDRSDTPWLVTGVTGSVEMLEILLPADPDLTLRNRFGGLAPIPAAERGHVDYIRRVVETGVDLDHVNDLGWTALLEAVILGDGGEPYQEIVQILVDAGVDTGIDDREGVTALEHARRRGYARIAAILD